MLVAIVENRATSAKSATSPATQQLSPVVTARRWVISVRNAQSQGIIARSSVRTVARVCSLSSSSTSSTSQANSMTVGHTKVRCKNAAAEGDGGFGNGGAEDSGPFNAPAGGDLFGAPAAEGEDSWGTAPPGGDAWAAAPAAPVAAGGW